MLFATEEEYREYTGNTLREEDFGEYGVGCLEEKLPTEIAKPKEVFIYAETGHGILYVAQKGVTFIKANAKKFAKDAGDRKAVFMSKKGTYNWKTVLV